MKTIKAQTEKAEASLARLIRWGDRYNRKAGTTAGGSLYWADKPWFGLTSKEWSNHPKNPANA
jgi:hypothetical protein